MERACHIYFLKLKQVSREFQKIVEYVDAHQRDRVVGPMFFQINPTVAE